MPVKVSLWLFIFRIKPCFGKEKKNIYIYIYYLFNHSYINTINLEKLVMILKDDKDIDKKKKSVSLTLIKSNK